MSAQPNGTKKTPKSSAELPAASRLLTEDDIRTGMNVAQTIYAVVMTFGLKIAFEALYPVIFAPHSPKVGTLSPLLISFVFFALMLLAMRFFWVIRNLYAYVLESINPNPEPTNEEKVFRRLMLYHFPIALIHAVLFFFICEAFVEITASAQPAHNPVIHFVGLYVALLLLNGLWLLKVTPKENPGPAKTVWATNNLIFGVLGFGVLLAFGIWSFSVNILLIAACVLFIINSVRDLRKAAAYYILFSLPIAQIDKS
jgi:hypothetical protein